MNRKAAAIVKAVSEGTEKLSAKYFKAMGELNPVYMAGVYLFVWEQLVQCDTLAEFEYIVQQQGLEERLLEALKTISDREGEVVRLRHFHQTAKPESMRKIGEVIGCSGQRTHQIFVRACQHLRHPKRAKIVFGKSPRYVEQIENTIEDMKKQIEEISKNKRETKDYEEIDIKEIDLDVRSYNALKRSGVDKLGRLYRTSRAQLAGVRCMGVKSVERTIARTIEALRERGFNNAAEQYERKMRL